MRLNVTSSLAVPNQGPLWKLGLGLAVALVAGIALPQAGWSQEPALPLKVELPPAAPGPCEADQLASVLEQPPSPRSRMRAQELLAQANQAALLGEDARARLLLRQAAGLDPTNTEVAYRLGRLLEASGEREAAVLEFCRVSLVDPEGPDTPDARERIVALAGRDEGQVNESARDAFQQGVEAVRDARYEDAVLHFSRTIVEAPTFADAHYNRAVAHLGAGRTGAGVADLDRYLELAPEASDRARVRTLVTSLTPTSGPMYSPRTTLVSGLVVPGMGHFYSGRPAMGLLVLGVAGAGVGVGLGYVDATVTCLVPPTSGGCPAGQVDTRTETRPLLVPGLIAAGVATVAGAIHAYRGVRGSGGRDVAARATTLPLGASDPRRAGSVGLGADGSLAVGLGALPGGDWAASLELLSAQTPAPGTLSAALRLHFP